MDVEGVLSILKPQEGAHILDWCGGWGRHSVLFAKRDFAVTLLDYAPIHIRRAKQLATAEGVKIDTVGADFRNTPARIQADYAVNLLSSGIGYLTEQDDITALRSLHSALKPNGSVLIDTTHLFWAVSRFQARSWYEYDAKLVVQSRKLNLLTERLTEVNVVKEKDKRDKKFVLDRRLYSANSLAHILETSGFVVQDVFGEFDQSKLTLKSSRVIVVASKK
jgi:ubiquinone/menaquinone biosynthesis C-methylase UbiE